MSKLIVHRGAEKRTLRFEGTPLVAAVLSSNEIHIDHPCGGRGVCGKCRIKALGALSKMSRSEMAVASRLACQTLLMGDAEVWLSGENQDAQIEDHTQNKASLGTPMAGHYGAAVDIGTTTVVLHLFDLHAGILIGKASMLNPQASVAADVMGRIGAAINGRLSQMKELIVKAVDSLLNDAAADAGIDAGEVSSMVITGNTTMLYLLTERDPECLSHSPFQMDTAFGTMYSLLGREAFLPSCMHAFVGADISCSIMSTGLCDVEDTALLCDIGTNGEIALWKDKHLYVTSTAAGPAFEGAGISCGCSSIAGAIDKVSVESGKLRISTIGGEKAVGVCGSGLVDAIAALLATGVIDETGACEAELLELSPGIGLVQADVRALQLAKAAVAAGIETLMDVSYTNPEDIRRFYIAGGFGSHLNIDSAAAIGLIPRSLAGKAQAVGNAALAGADMLLLDSGCVADISRIVSLATHVNLGGNPVFNDNYIDNMMFPEPDALDAEQ